MDPTWKFIKGLGEIPRFFMPEAPEHCSEPPRDLPEPYSQPSPLSWPPELPLGKQVGLTSSLTNSLTGLWMTLKSGQSPHDSNHSGRFISDFCSAKEVSVPAVGP